MNLLCIAMWENGVTVNLYVPHVDILDYTSQNNSHNTRMHVKLRFELVFTMESFSLIAGYLENNNLVSLNTQADKHHS